MASNKALSFNGSVELGSLRSVPIFEDTVYGRNWLAKLLEPKKVDGAWQWKREFCKRAGGDFYYVIDNLKVGDTVEFGADVISKRYPENKRKLPRRWYGVIAKLTATDIIIDQYPTAMHAWNEAQHRQEQSEKPKPTRRKLSLE